jgi:hypothetical protein
MIPLDLSKEENSDSEPFLTVDPKNPKNMAASAFMENPGGEGLSPLLVTSDGGDNWTVLYTIPSAILTADMTETSAPGGLLYAALLAHRTPAEYQLHKAVEFRAADTEDFEGSTLLSVRSSRFNVDQPWVTRVHAGDKDYVFIGSNDFNDDSGHTATVDISTDSGKTFRAVRLESRATSEQDAPSIRVSGAEDGTIYAAYLGWRQRNDEIRSTDVVVARDDRGAISSQPFRALIDDQDQLPGKIVAKVKVPFIDWATLGQERIGSTLSLAVLPQDSSTVYIAWGDRQGDGDIYSLHVRRSTDRGKTWSNDLRRIKNALCAALAVTPSGTIGFLYQQVDEKSGHKRWVTHLEQSTDAFKTVNDTVLATVPADVPDWGENLPYIGDYNFMTTVGDEFRGVFSANNTPDLANFPNGVRFLRKVDTEQKKLLNKTGKTEVKVSIDPFFFAVSAIK